VPARGGLICIQQSLIGGLRLSGLPGHAQCVGTQGCERCAVAIFACISIYIGQRCKIALLLLRLAYHRQHDLGLGWRIFLHGVSLVLAQQSLLFLLMLDKLHG
jgi:hypothetical protein